MSTTTQAAGLDELLDDYDRLRGLREDLERVLSHEERLDLIADAVRAGETIPDIQDSPATRAFKVAGVNRALDRVEAEAIDATAIQRGEAGPEDSLEARAADEKIGRAADAHRIAMADGEPRECVGELHHQWVQAVADKQAIVRGGARKPNRIDPEHRLTGAELGDAIASAFDADIRRRERVVKRGELLRIHDAALEKRNARATTSPAEDEILRAQPRLAGIDESKIDALLAEYHAEHPTTGEVE